MVLRTTIPAVVTAFACIIYWASPYKPEIIGDKHYVDYVLQIVGSLPGFYIAALAAAATFSNRSLDEEMGGKNVPMLDIQRGGETFNVALTLRVFMCHLFAYLCALSFLTCVIGVSIMEFAPILKQIEAENAHHSVAASVAFTFKYAVVGWFTFCLVRIVTITLHGLFFLIERMHQENR
ncbi:hypothetical protein MKK67_20810 [Methylobacterium sp. J-072]|uniref:hypothetical protein n=1 Tax=Methylobacterium sp. J-072 TaxID=2836651 RepID=UPI001FBB9962|nr:hypothetical protein [Methylobacterium sp. J-072]MCJ2094922.1 hypothetical protein [Methylobacterium sp. J-072]